jgi:hypothetical protein
MKIFWDVAPCSLVETGRRFGGAYCLHHRGDEAVIMGAVSISGTSINLYQTARRNIPEDSHLHTRHLENMKSHQFLFVTTVPILALESIQSYPTYTGRYISGGMGAGA